MVVLVVVVVAVVVAVVEEKGLEIWVFFIYLFLLWTGGGGCG